MASQYSGEYEARDERMDAYLKLVQKLAQKFDCFALTRIPRSENVQADALAALASSSDPGLKRVIPVEFIEHPSIGPPIVVNLIESQDDEEEEVTIQPQSEQSDYGCDTPWLETIRDYIINGHLPTEKWAARKVRTQAARYVTVDGEIYKWRFSGPLMTCLEGEKSKKSDGRSTFWVLRQPFRWKIADIENQTPWILLADNDRRLRKIRTKMRKMPEACSNHPTTSRSSLLHHIALSLYALGHGYRRTPS